MDVRLKVALRLMVCGGKDKVHIVADYVESQRAYYARAEARRRQC